MNDQLQQAIACIKSGNKVAAQQLLAQVIRADPQNEAAWLWMAATLDTSEKKEECLQRALQINPNNEMAKKGLAQIGSPKPPGFIGPGLKEQASQPEQLHLPQGEKGGTEVAASRPPASFEMPSALREVKALDAGISRKCPYCAETIKAEAIVCRFCGRDLTIPVQPQPLTSQLQLSSSPPTSAISDQQLLHRYISARTREGWQVVSQTDSSVQLRRAKRWNKTLLILGTVLLIVFGTGLLLWLLALVDYLLQKEQVVFMTVTEIKATETKEKVTGPGRKPQVVAGRKSSSGWRGPIIVGAVLVGLFIAFVACSLLPALFIQGSGPTRKDQPANTAVPPTPATKLEVPAGHLSEHIQDYSKYENVLVYKKDGTLDERPNDLEELCRDWLFYRGKIVEYEAAGQSEKATEARASFQQVNEWLSEYNENDVSAMFSMLE